MSITIDDLARMTVDEVLHRWPQTAQVFRGTALACLGCPMVLFCDITAVVDIYGLPKENFLADLWTVVQAE